MLRWWLDLRRAVIEHTTLRHKMGVLMAPYRGSHWFSSFPPPMRHREEREAEKKKKVQTELTFKMHPSLKTGLLYQTDT